MVRSLFMNSLPALFVCLSRDLLVILNMSCQLSACLSSPWLRLDQATHFALCIPVQTSTPASSFNEKSQTPDNVSRPTKFQRARMLRAGSSDSLEASEDDHNLPYR